MGWGLARKRPDCLSTEREREQMQLWVAEALSQEEYAQATARQPGTGCGVKMVRDHGKQHLQGPHRFAWQHENHLFDRWQRATERSQAEK